jgi:hypothetical protein
MIDFFRSIIRRISRERAKQAVRFYGVLVTSLRDRA